MKGKWSVLWLLTKLLMNTKTSFYVLFSLLSLLLLNSLAFAQITTASISGTIKDETGAVLPGVSLTVTHLDTGRTSATISDDQGRYRILNLALGNYRVNAELVGFQTTVRGGVTLSVGQEAVVDLTLRVGEITDKVEVTGEAPLVETTTSTLRALIDQNQIRDLPLNGRDFSQLAQLQAGVYAPPSMGQTSSSVGGSGPRLSVSGSRPDQNNFLLDGSDVMDVNGRTPGGVSGTTLGVETVREFTVLTNTYSAEYGKVAGGVINAVTKSGTNELHGSLFEFHRNDNLDARVFFDDKKPEFKRNQFGFTLGGPIVKDQTFFFGSYEGLRDRLGITQRSITLTPEARRGILPGGTVIPVDDRVKPFLALYPLPTPGGREFGDGRAEFVRAVSKPTNEDYFVIKVDHGFSQNHSTFVRYLRDNSSLINQGSFPGFQDRGKTARQFATIQDLLTVGPHWLNEFRFSFNRNIYGDDTEQTIQLDPRLTFVPGQQIGMLAVSGISSYGNNPRSNKILTQNMFEYIDNVSYSSGGNLMRFGLQVKRIQFNPFNAFAQYGEYRFTSFENLLRGQAFQLDVMTPGADKHRGWRQTYFGAYLHSEWALTGTLTFNGGLRWEFSSEPKEVNGKVANLVNPLTDAEVSVLKTLYRNPSLANLAPRLGMAWDVFGDGKTAVRGGTGIFYNVLLPGDYVFTATNLPPFFVRPLVSSPSFPNVLEVLAGGRSVAPPGLQIIDYTPDQPYMIKYDLNIQRQILSDFVVTIAYTGSNGVHAGRTDNPNVNRFEICPQCSSALANQVPAGTKFWPAGPVRRINPVFSAYALTTFDTRSMYNGLSVSANKRFSRGFQFQVAYTFSKMMDAASGRQGGYEVGGSSTLPLDPYDWKRDWSLAAFHVGNVFRGNFTLDLPVNVGGALKDLIGGWQVNGILVLADGSPVNLTNSVNRTRAANDPIGQSRPERPNLKPGGNNNLSRGRNTENYWDSSQFELQPAGFMGDLGRNTLIIPGVISFDFSVNKDIEFSEHRKLQFRAEFFNLFNRANFGQPSTNLFRTDSGVPDTTFGRIASTSTTARQIQFGLKYLF
ncbi:MAG: TonB-dependent receptor [Acidobacteria bacterium]|nr:TonB-dependent receptor [Acidobacteriota bacterium]